MWTQKKRRNIGCSLAGISSEKERLRPWPSALYRDGPWQGTYRSQMAQRRPAPIMALGEFDETMLFLQSLAPRWKQKRSGKD